MKKVTILGDFHSIKEPYQKLVLSSDLEDLFTKLNINDSISKNEDTIEKFGFCSEAYTDWDDFVDSIKNNTTDWIVVAFINSEGDISILISLSGLLINFLLDKHLVIESPNNTIVEDCYKKKDFNLFKDFIKI